MVCQKCDEIEKHITLREETFTNSRKCDIFGVKFHESLKIGNFVGRNFRKSSFESNFVMSQTFLDSSESSIFMLVIRIVGKAPLLDKIVMNDKSRKLMFDYINI